MSVEELEILRKKTKNKIFIGIFISIIISIITTAILYYYVPVYTFLGLPILMILIILTLLISKKPVKNFTLTFKKVFVLKALKDVFTDLTYRPGNGLKKEDVYSSGMTLYGERYASNDYISAKYKNVSFRQADVHIKKKIEHTTKDRHEYTYYVTIFKGRWMIFDFNKEFKANVQVKGKNFLSFKNPFTAVLFKFSYKKIRMENHKFNKRFKTYAQDEHDAFYILTPHLMEKMIEIDKNIKSPLLFCFSGNKLHVGIQNGKDSFEHSVLRKINEEKEKNKVTKEIKLITSFVDELSLDKDIFK